MDEITCDKVQEENTRATTVFIQKYLVSMNLILKMKYLIMFFENLLLNKNNKLNNDEI